MPARSPLVEIPLQLDGWTGRDMLIRDDVRQILGQGDFLSRLYGRSPGTPYIELFIAYFPTQRTGSTIHSPQNCLPGAGWVPLEAGRMPVPAPGLDTITVNRYLIGRGLDRQLVLYWYQSRERAIASEYWAKFYLVADSIRLNRSDGALVRVITPLAPGESAEQAEQRLVSFTQVLRPRLDRYIPR